MVFCGICKENKETKNRWLIREHAVDNSPMREFKICDGCAANLIRQMMEELKEPQEAAITLTRTGIIDNITLCDDNALEIVLSMDLARARKVVLDQTEAK